MNRVFVLAAVLCVALVAGQSSSSAIDSLIVSSTGSNGGVSSSASNPVPSSTGDAAVPSTGNIPSSTGNDNVPTSTGNNNVPTSTGNNNVQTSTGNNVQTSTGNNNVETSTGSNNVQTSTGSNNVQTSTGSNDVQTSTGNNVNPNSTVSSTGVAFVSSTGVAPVSSTSSPVVVVPGFATVTATLIIKCDNILGKQNVTVNGTNGTNTMEQEYVMGSSCLFDIPTVKSSFLNMMSKPGVNFTLNLVSVTNNTVDMSLLLNGITTAVVGQVASDVISLLKQPALFTSLNITDITNVNCTGSCTAPVQPSSTGAVSVPSSTAVVPIPGKATIVYKLTFPANISGTPYNSTNNTLVTPIITINCATYESAILNATKSYFGASVQVVVTFNKTSDTTALLTVVVTGATDSVVASAIANFKAQVANQLATDINLPQLTTLMDSCTSANSECGTTEVVSSSAPAGPEESNDDDKTKKIIIGVVVGVGGFLIILVIVLCCCCRNKKREFTQGAEMITN